MRNIFRTFTYSLVCFLPLISPLNASHSAHQIDVLAVHSYHQEYPWTSSQYDAFKRQLKQNLPEYTVNFSSEYLDTKRITPSKQYQKDFLHYLSSKHGKHPPDFIYVTDDNALNFIHSNKNTLNWNIPVVYSGINNRNIKTNIPYTLSGVFEYKDIISSISLAKKITKKGDKIIFIGDGGVTDKAIRKIINNRKHKKNGFEITHRSFSNINALITRIYSMAEGTIILTTIGGIRDNENNILKLQKIIKAITNTGRKVLVMEDAYLFEGVLGGYVTSGRIQGETAAYIASQIVRKNNKGKVEAKSSSEFILSYPEIKRFKIDINDKLLKQAKIINQPRPFLEQYPEISKWLLWFASILLIIIFGFILNTRRKNIQLKEQYTDSITGLPNRVRLLKDIEKQTKSCLIIIDINNFKSINNLYGLNVGDKLLKTFGYKVSQYIINHKHTLYRSGGNQFAILSSKIASKGNADEYIKKLLNDMQNNIYHLGDIDINLTLTAGISRNEQEFLIPRAEQALQKAKEHNKDYIIFEKERENAEQHHQNILWAKKLHAALTDNRIVPYYQLITHNRTKEKNKFEALVRLVDEDGEIIPPSFFLNAAKTTRQYSALTKIMIEKSFQAIGEHDISISINFTVEDVRNKKTIKFFKSKLDEYNVAKKVIVELTESEGIESYTEVSNFIHDIKKLGCRVAIDDFGTGYSNFTHLIHLNVDYLKIDGSIIQNILKDNNAEIVAITLVDFAKQLGIETIAEFVDSQEILDKVKELGIDYSQGDFLGKPQSTLFG